MKTDVKTLKTALNGTVIHKCELMIREAIGETRPSQTSYYLQGARAAHSYPCRAARVVDSLVYPYLVV